MTDKRANGVRITIVVPTELNQKLREIQSKLIPHCSKSVSFSSVLTECADLGIKNVAQVKKILTDKHND